MARNSTSFIKAKGLKVQQWPKSLGVRLCWRECPEVRKPSSGYGAMIDALTGITCGQSVMTGYKDIFAVQMSPMKSAKYAGETN